MSTNRFNNLVFGYLKSYNRKYQINLTIFTIFPHIPIPIMFSFKTTQLHYYVYYQS